MSLELHLKLSVEHASWKVKMLIMDPSQSGPRALGGYVEGDSPLRRNSDGARFGGAPNRKICCFDSSSA